MKVEVVISPIHDKDIQKNIQDSEIWKDCYHTDEELPINRDLWKYTIKFDGLKPVQVLSIKYKSKIQKNDKKNHNEK